MYIYTYIYTCIYTYIYAHVCDLVWLLLVVVHISAEEINVLWRVIANERRAHRRCSGTDGGTAARPATACSALLRVRHRLGAPAPAVGAKSGSCREEQTEVRFQYFCAVAPSPTASAGPHNQRATCDPYIPPGFCLFRISMLPWCTLHTLPAAKAAICRPCRRICGCVLQGAGKIMCVLQHAWHG